MIESPEIAQARLKRSADGGHLIELSGDWDFRRPAPDVGALSRSLEHGRALSFCCANLSGWDSALLLFLDRLLKSALTTGIAVDLSGLPPGVQRLLRMATAVAPKVPAEKTPTLSLFGRLAHAVHGGLRQGYELLYFIGEAMLALGRLLRGRARIRRRDFLLFFQQAGVEALPIVGMLSFLIGLILAFVGALQLIPFGAQVYVANLVGIGSLREMGAMMTAIIMAGRTGAAYAAQLGAMQVNEEIDALRTLGVSPLEFLVLPRLLALTLVMPLLCVYADILGILGGMAVSVSLYDLGALQYLEQTRSAVSFADFAVGLFKSLVFGLLIATAGCLRGLSCGRSAGAVGEATTQAVVASIVSIVVADAAITLLTTIVGI
jgi:phospholipid/cholesterol/gamma-HCH transport system permease protein